MSDAQLEDVARTCNRYPDIQLNYELVGGSRAPAGDAVTVSVDLQREQAGELRPVDAPRYATEALRALQLCHMQFTVIWQPGKQILYKFWVMTELADFGHRYPGRKEEQWWLVVGDPKANSLLAIKRVTLLRKSKLKLEFAAPTRLGKHSLVLFFMCDSYMGCDQVTHLPHLHLLPKRTSYCWLLTLLLCCFEILTPEQ